MCVLCDGVGQGRRIFPQLALAALLQRRLAVHLRGRTEEHKRQQSGMKGAWVPEVGDEGAVHRMYKGSPPFCLFPPPLQSPPSCHLLRCGRVVRYGLDERRVRGQAAGPRLRGVGGRNPWGIISSTFTLPLPIPSPHPYISLPPSLPAQPTPTKLGTSIQWNSSLWRMTTH